MRLAGLQLWLRMNFRIQQLVFGGRSSLNQLWENMGRLGSPQGGYHREAISDGVSVRLDSWCVRGRRQRRFRRLASTSISELCTYSERWSRYRRLFGRFWRQS